MAPKVGEPQVKFEPEEQEVLFGLICKRIAEGKSGTSICRDGKEQGLPSYGMFLDWASSSPDRIATYARAKQKQADAIAEETLDIADGATPLTREVARLRVDVRKWYAGKVRPRVYGDKIAIGGADDLPPIRTIDASKLSTETLLQLREAMDEEPDAD